MPTRLRVPAVRLERWVENFAARHAETTLEVRATGLAGRSAADGSTFELTLPFETAFTGPADPADLARAVEQAVPEQWGVLLVRKGGFAIARLEGRRIVESKVGQRHVQGRTKAGGQSQQRFARRRDNQARQAFEAAAEHAVRILGDLRGPLATGGDRRAVGEVLEDPRLRGLRVLEHERDWLAVPDPRRAVLEAAIEETTKVHVEVHDSLLDQEP